MSSDASPLQYQTRDTRRTNRAALAKVVWGCFAIIAIAYVVNEWYHLN